MQQATEANTAIVLQSADKSYARNYKVFCKWVDIEFPSTTPRSCYITGETIDSFFSQYIANNLKINPDTARRFVSSLQFFANYKEYIVGVEFDVGGRRIVKQSLLAQKQRYYDNANRSFGTQSTQAVTNDPHSSLPTNVLTYEDYKRALQHVIRNWSSVLYYCWTLCFCTLIRNCTFRLLTLSKIRTDDKNGPPAKFGDKRILTIILCGKGTKRLGTTRVTGCYRHKDPFMCPVGATFIHLCQEARQGNYDCIDFFRPDFDRHGTIRTCWREHRLQNCWGSYDSANKAFRHVLEKLGLKWSKVTHMKKLGMDYLSKLGVDTNDITSLSKHGKDKKFRYLTELSPSALMVMAGFSKEEDTYTISRSSISFGKWLVADIINSLFPDYTEWCDQQRSIDGDRSTAAHNFLFETIPFAATVIWQDGIYWVTSFPQHEWSLFLLSSFPVGYDIFAKENRDIINKDMAIQSSVASSMVRGEIECQVLGEIRSQNMKLLDHLCQMENNVANININLGDVAVSTLQNRTTILEQCEIFRQVHHTLLSTLLATSKNVSNLGSITSSTNGEHSTALSSTSQPSNSTGTTTTPSDDECVEDTKVRGNVVKECHAEPSNFLRQIPQIPAFPTDLPKTVSAALREYESALISHHDARKNYWPMKMQVAFSKRKYLYCVIKARAEKSSHPKDYGAVATLMDRERGIMTLNKYICHLKSQDASVRKRKRDDEDEI